MREPKPSTVKRLFALSRNCCAYPQCSLPIVEESGIVTGIICHIKARSKGGPRYDDKQTAEERHSFANLVLLCARHSKVIDTDPKKFTVELLCEMKQAHEKEGGIELSQSDAALARNLMRDYRVIYINSAKLVKVAKAESIHAKTVKVGSGKTVIAPPGGSVASSLVHRNYTKHLIDRYNEFASDQPDREFKFQAIYSTLKSKFRAKWDLVPLSRFDEMSGYLQKRIDETRLGRINTAKGIRNYSTFERYKEENGYV